MINNILTIIVVAIGYWAAYLIGMKQEEYRINKNKKIAINRVTYKVRVVK